MDATTQIHRIEKTHVTVTPYPDSDDPFWTVQITAYDGEGNSHTTILYTRNQAFVQFWEGVAAL